MWKIFAFFKLTGLKEKKYCTIYIYIWGGGVNLNFWNMVHIIASISIFLINMWKILPNALYYINSHTQTFAYM